MSEKETKPEAQRQPKENESPVNSGVELEKLRQESERIQQELDNIRKEKDDIFGRLQRVYADYANFQKRVPKNIADTVAYEKERFIRSFLPILDNFDRTLREARGAQNVEAVIKGVEIIRDQMLGVLKSYEVEPIQSLGEKFDPARHEAMLRRSEPDQENDIVLEEFQKGYTLNGKVIRPSRVAINKIQPGAGPNGPQRPQATEETAAEGTEATGAASE